MSASKKKSELFNDALVAEGLLWSTSQDATGKGQTVLVDASDPSADPVARNIVYLASMVCAVMTRGTDNATLAAAVRAKFDGDGTHLIAILGE